MVILKFQNANLYVAASKKNARGFKHHRILNPSIRIKMVFGVGWWMYLSAF